MKLLNIHIFFFLILLFPVAHAQVSVKGYYRSNGTYVRPHIRSNPDGQKWNNYGPSYGVNMMSSSGRDADGDGTENRFDWDDDNDGMSDDHDSSQYGSGK